MIILQWGDGMYKTYKEIFGQHEALRKTYEYFMENAEKIKHFWNDDKKESLTFTGCGSSYSVCRSAEISARIRLGKPAFSMATGDLLINFDHYEELIKNTVLVAPSRSGSTSEVVMAVKKAKEQFNVPCISISAKKDSELSLIADLSLEIPWAFDESVCQTRTVTNLYMACLMLVGIMAEDEDLLHELKEAVENQKSYIDQYSDLLKDIVEKHEWDKVIVLGDSELQGIAEEGALAFKEICRIHSSYHHVLDVRHGPMVLIDNKTLVIVACNQEEISLQKDLIRDLKAKGALVVAISGQKENIWGSDYHVALSLYRNFGVAGVPFIFVPQALSYYKAIERGVNSDAPEGLDPWIKL